MKIPEFSVNRRVTTIMLALILVVLGMISFSRLGLDFFPDLEYPTVSVITNYSGVSPEDIENTITRPLEQVINSVSGVKNVNSVTSEGISVVMVDFEWGTNLDFAAQDIRDQIGLYKSYLPEDASDPLVVKFDISQMPIIFWGITSNMPNYELKELFEEEVTPRLERIEGVASAQVFSTDTREIRVELDRAALESRMLSSDRVIQALRMENINLPAGYIVERHSELLVRTLGEFENLDDIRNTVVGSTQTGDPIYMEDVAEIKDTVKEPRYLARVQKEKGVYLFISKRSGANTVTAAEAVKKELEEIKQTLPEGIEFHTAMDQSDMIQDVIRQTGGNALAGGVLAILFIFIFLGNWRPTITIAAAIPLSVIATFIAFYTAGYTLNLLTLGGLALGIGMLVDNAIVVIENIFRHLEEGEARTKAAKIGASEVGMAITASTLTTIAVFFPMVFAQGITGKLTRGLALAIAFSLVASLFVALTVVPMLASYIFKLRKKRMRKNGTPKKRVFSRIRDRYENTLLKALQNRGKVLAGAVLLLFISMAMVPFIGTEFMPTSDRDMLLIKVKMPIGTSLEETDRVTSLAEEVILNEPEVDIVSAQVGSMAEEDPSDAASGFGASGVHEALLWIGLRKQEQRDLSDIEVLEKIRDKLPDYKGVEFESIDMSQMMMGGAQAPIEIKVFGKDLDRLKETADLIVSRIKGVEGLRDVGHSMEKGKPEYQIQIDREEAARMGLMVAQIANTVQTVSLGTVATKYREGDDEFDVKVRFEEKYRDDLDDIKNIPLMTPANTVIKLSQVATIEEGVGPTEISRENQGRLVTISANIAGRDLGSIMEDIKDTLTGLENSLPAGYFLEYGGQYEDMQEAFLIIIGVFVLASLLVYMIMASQFESFLHPLVIMFTIPLGVIGVIFGLLVTGNTISLISLIGFIILGGIAVNNGIVMVDYINQLRRKGTKDEEAILKGCSVRLRPVLITALTTMIGMLPMAISTSAGSEMRAPMAIAVIGGLFATTLLTLFVIPIMYSIFGKVSFKRLDKNKS
ncbi:MAG: MMPL family transporter [Candidatus Aminicenantes bacterium]|nr:MMPL family transporter [Candidatus Aminicenantes bacterium]